MTLEYVMRQNGVVPGTDAAVDTTVQFNMMAGAFTGGNGDFVTLFEPTATEVAQAGKGYILASIGQESGEIPYTAYFASQAYIHDHADIVQRFTNAIARAQKWIAEHDAAQTAEIIAPQFPDTSVPVLVKSYMDSLSVSKAKIDSAAVESDVNDGRYYRLFAPLTFYHGVAGDMTNMSKSSA